MFEIPKAIVSRFTSALKRTGEANDEGADVAFEMIEGSPREEARQHKRAGRPNDRGPRGNDRASRPGGHAPRPFKSGRKGPPRGR